MTTLFSDKDGNLLKWNTKINDTTIKIGDTLTIEYKRIKIVSKNFDLLGKSQVMVINNVKFTQTKEKMMDTITYFNDDAKPEGKWYNRKKSINIGPFDPSDYGNPVCYFTPGYKGSIITIRTKFWELDDANKITQTTNIIQDFLKIGSTVPNPYGPYFQIADDIVGISGKILTCFVKHSELSDDHIIEFRIDEENKPFFEGYYLCLPEMPSNQKNEIKEIIKNYFIDDDNILIRKDNSEEYNSTYFVFRVSNNARNDLIDFDFAVSSSDLLNKLNQKHEDFIPDIIKISRDAYDMDLVQKIYDAYDNNDLNLVSALYKSLHHTKKQWFNKAFPIISDKIMDSNNNLN